MNRPIKKRISSLFFIIAITVQPICAATYMEMFRDWFRTSGQSMSDFIYKHGGAILFSLAVLMSKKDQAQSLLTHSIEPIPVTDVTLKDYIGVPPAVDILIDQIKNPKIYKNLNAPFTKGILLTGKPGTGKSFLAKAIAGEAQVPFFSVSAPEFGQLYVGASALMVRNLFKNAKLAALSSPSKLAIIFIDEIDGIGSRASSGLSGASTGIVQTLLTEMDGFNKISAKDLNLPSYKTMYVKEKQLTLPEINVIVLAATNTPDAIDSALKRSGRFDDIIEVGNPNEVSREKIIELYLKDYRCEKDVEAKRLAMVTDGMTPADIKAVFQAAARDAAKNRQELIEIKNFCRVLFDAKGGKQMGNYEQRVLEILTTMYPCDLTITVDNVANNIIYANVQEIVDLFADTYKRIAVIKELEQKLRKEDKIKHHLIGLNDLMIQVVINTPTGEIPEVPIELTE